MNRLVSAIRLMFCLPPLWIALAVGLIAILVNGKEPFVDIALYAIQRLFH